MSKDRRLYARIDIGFDEHDKIFPLSDAAFRALIEMTLYARRQLTDGFLGERLALKKWGADVVQELCENDADKPSLIRVNDGWQIHDFAEHQTTKADIEAKREAGRKGGLAKAKARQESTEDVAGAKQVLQQKGSTMLAKTETETETETISSKELINMFALIWDSWPKKTEKDRAFKEFKKHYRSVDDLVELIKQFGEAYAVTTDKQFVPSLAAWLHRKRWTDELPTASSSNAQSAMQKNMDRFYQEFGGDSRDGRGSVQAIDAGFSA